MREEAPPQSSNFRGPAQTLGGDDAPSRSVDDPEANRPPAPQVVKRRLHFWENGFSVDDGPLYDINKPENAEILKMIHKGRAPLNIMNVEPNSEVDVSVEEHHGPYVQPKQKYQPFAGQGQRLGSPTVSAQGEPAAPRLNNPPRSQSGAQSAPVTIDSDQPTISLQIRLGDGTRLVSRFNTTHTIGDVYEFVSASSPASSARPWALMTTFPSRELTDMTVQLGDTSDLKKGGVVVQKWK